MARGNERTRFPVTANIALQTGQEEARAPPIPWADYPTCGTLRRYRREIRSCLSADTRETYFALRGPPNGDFVGLSRMPWECGLRGCLRSLRQHFGDAVGVQGEHDSAAGQRAHPLQKQKCVLFI